MAWRFKASKYKNAAPIVPKPEACIRDISVGSYQTYGNNIASSASFMAFNVDHNGSSLAVLPIDDCGRKSKTMPLLHAHTDTVTDMDFSPFHDGLLATGSQDCLVKIWHIPEKGLEESLSNAECTFSHKQRRVETVCFHPTADNLLTSTSFTTLTLWDVTSEKELLSNADHSDVIQSLSWKKDGSVLATSCKDKQVRVIDPRANCNITHSANSHQSIKDSRVIWLGDNNRILTTGFDSGRQREVYIRDLRNFEEVEKALVLDSSTGILIPLYDADTGMLFLAGKGDTTIAYLEVTDREPFLVEGIRHNGEQTKGACLVPKRALSVMQGEVNRLLQLTSTSVIPIMYQVPRKSYRDFHADLFPDTPGCESALSASQWMEGKNATVPRISLDPSKRKTGEAPIQQPRLGPKPFTPPKLNFGSTDGDVKTTTDFSFDKVFSVPSVPNHESMNGNISAKAANESVAAVNNENGNETDSANLKQSPVGGVSPEVESKPIIDNAGEGNTPDNEDGAPGSPNGTDKTPSTAERRKLFEKNVNSVPGEQETAAPADAATTEESSDDKLEDFERASLQRTSIAERRRLYENRSMSVQETTMTDKRSPTNLSPTPLRRRDSFKTPKPVPEEEKAPKKQPDEVISKGPAVDKKPEPATTPTPKRTSTVFGRVSKFRHLKGTPLHKSTHIENIRNISRQISGECDGFHANPERVAVPLSGPGGKIAVFELSRAGKLPDGVIPTLVQGTNVMDFAWDPFNFKRLAVACDDGTIRLWIIPDDGLPEPTNTPDQILARHSEKIYFIKFHPLAKDVLASGSYDMTIRIWDLQSQTEKIVLEGHTDQMFSFAWSPCGKYCATVCKDSKLRVYEPRKQTLPVREGRGPVGSRGARVVWALDGHYIVVTGFDKVSERQIQVFKADNLNSPLNTVGLDVSPAILIPFYDEDSSTLFVTGKGDSTIYAFEVAEESPYLCPLSHHRCNSLHQGLSFLPKNVCDVSNVEFARALRLTNNTIEPLSFTVPRIKSDLFQDDLFPPTKETWKPMMTSNEWFSGANKTPSRISLKPEGMESLSDVQGGGGDNNKQNTSQGKGVASFVQQPFNRLAWNPELSDATKEKQEQIQRAVSSRMEVNLKLEQDDMEGVDEREWED